MTTTPRSRPTRDEYFLQWAVHASTRGTCYRRKVGCILINARGHVLGSGYNGVEAGANHCNEVEIVPPKKVWIQPFGETVQAAYPIYPNACKGAFLASGTGLDECDAIHAEQNALLQCNNVFEIDTCYVTHSPCIHCVKLLMGTSCTRIVFREKYAHDEPARLKWLKRNNNVQNVQRKWIHIPGEANAS